MPEPLLDKYYTELDKQLRDIAILDWPGFVKLVGEDAITNAKVCLLKGKGKSYNQIATRLSITKNQAQYGSNKCKCE